MRGFFIVPFTFDKWQDIFLWASETLEQSTNIRDTILASMCSMLLRAGMQDLLKPSDLQMFVELN